MKFLSYMCGFLALSALAVPSARGAELELRPGDHVCLVGNALGERMQHHNHWETLLHARFPKHELVVRNLCFPGDEPAERLRSLNFGSPDDHLKHSGASVVLFFFGYNESYRSAQGRESFAAELRQLIEETRQKDYSGQGPPRMVLISPIAFEPTGDPNLPDGNRRNARLAETTAIMRRVARDTQVGFVDLFAPTRELFARHDERLTLNGFHLNDRGYRLLAPLLDQALFGDEERPAFSDALHAAIADKNFHWWHRYRAVNGYSIYGKRGAAGSDGTYNNTDVMERERAILDQMCANRDRRIWDLAQGKQVPEQVDDGNTLPFIDPKTNVGGADDNNRKAGKLGSLDYLPAAEQQKRFKLATGYEINLVASEEQFPELANPVAINFDARGRLWVATMPSYPQWKPKTPLDDKLLILEDHDQDGRADECRVFAGGLHQPTGFEFGEGGVFVAQQPDILFLRDTDGDDREDERVRRLIGFDSADSHHGISAFEWGPGGGLYFQEGTFKQSQIETIDGVLRLGDAGVWRYDPRTEDFQVHVSFAFANPWGHVFDRWGQNFIADASPGYNYWAAPISGFVPYPDKHPGGARDRALDWGGPKSDKPFPTFIVKRTRPSSGCEIVSSRHFPPEAQGNFLLNNVIGDRAVLQHRVREEGSGFQGEEVETLVSGEDGNFRPVDLQFAPDGSLYIVDWHNALIGHLQHNLREPNRDHRHGRIWRVTYKDRPLLKAPQIAGAPLPALLDLLKAPEDRTRYRARRELATRETPQVMAALKTWVAGLDNNHPDFEHRLLEALWVHQTHNVLNEPLLDRLLESPNHRARAAATRVLSYWLPRLDEPLERLARLVHDEHPRVRLEAVRACSFLHVPRSIEVALDVLNHEMDYHLEYTLDETVRVLEEMVGGGTGQLAHAHHAGHAGAQHAHNATGAGDAGHGKPLVFLDKSPRIVKFQLDRLAPSQLLMVDRSAEDEKFKPVFEAIVGRAGVSRQDREEAAAALGKLNGSSVIKELLIALARTDPSQPEGRLVARQLSAILVRQPRSELEAEKERLRQASGGEQAAVRAAALAAWMTLGEAEQAWSLAGSTPRGRQDFLAAVPLVESAKTRGELRERIVECLASGQPAEVRLAGIRALASVPVERSANFALVAPLVKSPRFRTAAVGTLSRIPPPERPREAAVDVVKTLIELAESTPPAKRTTQNFLDAMHLADELIGLLPVDQARSYRERMREVVVRVVRITTVQEEMRYDTPYFAVEAGRPVQLVLRNEDLMSHNLVIAAPGKFRDVVEASTGLPPTIDAQGRQFVPDTPDVLLATRMVPAHSQDVLTFTAPREPGEYPYVCTFPNHWMRMYGVMVVVEDLDAWLSNPTAPADPLGITRDFVQDWKPADFEGDLAAAIRARRPEIGQRLFKEATCLQCHKMQGEGGAVGPELTGVLQRHKGDYRSVLAEILDPSLKVDPKYALYNILTVDGRVLSGIVTNQNAESITVISNPEKPEPQVIAREDIEQMIKSSASLMPKGLLDRYTREEILQLLAYVTDDKGASPAAPSSE